MYTLIQQLSSLSEIWAQWTLASLVSTLVVLAIVATIWYVAFRDRWPQMVCLLFFLVLLKPFVPLNITVPNSVAFQLPIATVQPPSYSEARSESAFIETPESRRIAETSAPSVTTSSIDAVTPDVLPELVEVAASAEAETVVKPQITNRFPWLIPFLLYLCILTFLVTRFLLAQHQFHQLVLSAKPLPDDKLPLDFEEACLRAGVARPTVIEMDTDSPAVWGVCRPTLCLPKNLVRELAPESLKWAVMHELAHIKRRDVLFHAVQRMLTIMQFWNPTAWIASAMISRFREQACDDMALVWSDRQPIAASEAFMYIVRSTNDNTKRSNHLATSLGVFSSGGKRACSRRLSRLLDTERPLREKMGVVATLILVVAAVSLLPKLRVAAESPKPVPEAPQPTFQPKEFVPASDGGEFELIVVDPDGRPIPKAEVEIRPRIQSDWEILKGSFTREGTYGIYTQTDAEGTLRVSLPDERLSNLRFSIKAPGYGLFWAQWRMGEKSEVLPASFVARLDAGQTVGGILVDESGNPVSGAKVHPSIEYKKRETDESQLATGWRATTDEDGRWQCPYVPQSFASLSVEIVHPEFAPMHATLSLPRYQIAVGKEPSETIQIQRGITLTGRVTDNSGNPIADAKIRSVFVNETRVAATDQNGDYRMPGCPEGNHPITVTATTFAPDQKVVSFAKDLGPVDFKLSPGNTVRVKVVDKDGTPKSNARIFFKRWREDQYGKGLGTVHQYTNEQGIWEWNEAPDDSFVVDVCPRGCVQIDDQTLKARPEEYVFEAISELVISGKVTDLKTGNPISSFRVVPGMVWENRTYPFWMRDDSFDARDGEFRLNRNRMDGLHAVRIEAEGFIPVASRHIDIKEGNAELEFRLEPASPMEIKVSTPEGSPATGAEALIGVAGTQVQIENGEFRSGTYGKRVTANAQGVLSIPPDGSEMRLVVLHKSGYADVLVEAGKTIDSVPLIAWARIRGKLMHGNNPAHNVPLTLSPNQSQPSPNVPHVSWSDTSVTDINGEFAFSRVRPAKLSLYQTVHSHNNGRTSRSSVSHRQVIEIDPGEQRSIQLGGSDFHIKGKAVAQLTSDTDVDWEFSSLIISPVLGERPMAPIPEGLSESERREWYSKWIQTDAGKDYQTKREAYFQESIQEYRAKIGEGGAFEVHGVPQGKYRLTIQLDSRPVDENSEYKELGEAELDLDLNERNGRLIDLGEVIIE